MYSSIFHRCILAAMVWVMIMNGDVICAVSDECKDRNDIECKANNVLIYDSNDQLSESIGLDIISIANESINQKGSFIVALSGGSLPDIIANGILKHKDSIDFTKWYIFFADERHVDHNHPDSNLLACNKAFLSKTSIPKYHIYGNDFTVSVEESADEYGMKIASVFTTLNSIKDRLPVFDLILLGMGPDGHTCSLFPNHPLLDEDRVFVAPISDSPKPPPERITLTFPVLNAAKNVYFVATGSSKVDIIPQVVISKEKLEQMGSKALPAARVRPTNGTLKWYIDKAAAAKL